MAVKISALPTAPLFELTFDIPTSDVTITTYKASGVQLMTAFLTAQGYDVQPECFCASDSNLDATYDNGVDGVGASLTMNNNGLFTCDGITPPIASIVLVPNQTDAIQNGAYVLIDEGSFSTPAILVRVDHWDESSEIVQNQIFPILYGNDYANRSFTYVGPSARTFGTDDLVFSLTTPITPQNIQNMTFSKGTTTGDSEEYYVDVSPQIGALQDDQMFLINFHTPNDGGANLYINGLGPLLLVDSAGTELWTNAISTAGYRGLVVVTDGQTKAALLNPTQPTTPAGWFGNLTSQFIVAINTTTTVLWDSFSLFGGIGTYNSGTGEITVNRDVKISTTSAFAPASAGVDAPGFNLVVNGTIVRNGVLALDTASNVLGSDIYLNANDVVRIDVVNTSLTDTLALNPGQISSYWDVTVY